MSRSACKEPTVPIPYYEFAEEYCILVVKRIEDMKNGLLNRSWLSFLPLRGVVHFYV